LFSLEEKEVRVIIQVSNGNRLLSTHCVLPGWPTCCMSMSVSMSHNCVLNLLISIV